MRNDYSLIRLNKVYKRNIIPLISPSKLIKNRRITISIDNYLQRSTTVNSLSKLLPNLVSSKGKIYESTTRYRRIYHSLRNDWWRGKSNFRKARNDGDHFWIISKCDGLCRCLCWSRLRGKKGTRQTIR